MLPVGFARFGWFDSVGPLWFLQPRWSCGTRWRPCWARFFAGRLGVTLQAHSKKGGYAVDGTFVQYDLWNDLSYAQKEDFVMAWVRRVRRPEGGSAGALAASDSVWLHDYPALHEHLVLSTHPDGAQRRTSTLTLFVDGGSWKCFVNERDVDASLCASGPTIADALSALETILEGEVVPWRFSDRPRPENGRKGRGRS